MNIVFTNTTSLDLEYPKPASKVIPEWYRKTESYLGNEKKPDGNGVTTGTIKRCMPVYDAITAGYIIESPVDVFVTKKDDEQYFEWSDMGIIHFHPVDQAPLHPMRNAYPYPKWVNPWSIKTPKGYSTLFVQPFHRESVFTIMPGIVDTDIYVAQVFFPFVINDINFTGLIPKGTPIAQVIPLKRDKFTMVHGDSTINALQQKQVAQLRSKFFDRYKTLFWARKEYK